jgi:ribonucleotide monophosphatase NagD (HAD superfamily)
MAREAVISSKNPETIWQTHQGRLFGAGAMAFTRD